MSEEEKQLLRSGLNESVDSDDGIIENRVLNSKEIEIAYKIIDNKYPLKFLKIDEVLPIKCLTKCCKTKKRANTFDSDRLRNLMMVRAQRDLDQTQDPESETNQKKMEDIKNYIRKMIKDNPFSIYGIGIMTQFNIMKHLIIIFSIFTILCIPNIILYSHHEAMKGLPNFLSLLTLGNFGFSSASCFSVTKEIGTMTLFCNTGLFKRDISNNTFGIMPSSSNMAECLSSSKDSQVCQGSFDINGFLTQYKDECADDEFCVLKDLDKYFIGSPTSGCNNPKSVFFINAQCIQETDLVNTKRVEAHYIVCICILISLLFLIMLYYSRRTSLISGKEWDLKTITAGDYTVSMSIDQVEYDQFLQTHTNDPYPVYSYMNFLKENFENEIGNFPAINEETYTIKIANISFAFKNYKMIRLLEQRGSAISNRNSKKKEKIEKQIDDLTDKNGEDLSTPTYVFVTFETQEGYERAKRCKVYGRSFIPAVEPTNVIWENYRFTRSQKLVRKLLFLLFISCLMVFSFALFVLIKYFYSQNKNDYMRLNCNYFEESISKHHLDNTTQLKYAIIDYYGYYYKPKGDKRMIGTKMTGALQCYCNSHCSTLNFLKCIDEESSHEDIKVDGKPYVVKLCSEYMQSKYINQFGGYFLSSATVVYNFFLRLIIIAVIKRIGVKTVTNQTRLIMIYIFVLQFFNTVFLNLLTYANIKEAIGIPFPNGRYSDFTYNWYLDFGVPLMGSMIINAFFPVIEFCIWYFLRISLRFYDRGFRCRGTQKTKKKSLQAFINLFSGTEYEIHYIYSRILNIVFITFMFGIAIPLLFPIALLSLVVLYIVERLALVYYYREPPAYDIKLSDTAIKIMNWAPMFMFAFGYWMMSNRQIFYNEFNIDEKANPDVEKTNHSIYDGVSKGPEMNLFIMIVAFPLCFIAYHFINFLIPKCKSRKRFLEYIKESLPNYFDALSWETQQILINEEVEVMRKSCNIKTKLNNTLYGINSSKPCDRFIQGVGYYDILANIRYQEKFQYFILQDDERRLNHKDDYFVRICLNYAFKKKENLPPMMLGCPIVSPFQPMMLMAPSPPSEECESDQLMMSSIPMLGGLDSENSSKSKHNKNSVAALMAPRYSEIEETKGDQVVLISDPPKEASSLEEDLLLRANKINLMKSKFNKNMFKTSENSTML